MLRFTSFSPFLVHIEYSQTILNTLIINSQFPCCISYEILLYSRQIDDDEIINVKMMMMVMVIVSEEMVMVMMMTMFFSVPVPEYDDDDAKISCLLMMTMMRLSM